MIKLWCSEFDHNSVSSFKRKTIAEFKEDWKSAQLCRELGEYHGIKRGDEKKLEAKLNTNRKTRSDVISGNFQKGDTIISPRAEQFYGKLLNISMYSLIVRIL